MTSCHNNRIHRKRPYPIEDAPNGAVDMVDIDSHQEDMFPSSSSPSSLTTSSLSSPSSRSSTDTPTSTRRRLSSPSSLEDSSFEESMLPCEVEGCNFQLPINQYNQHMLTHHLEIVQRHQQIELEEKQQEQYLTQHHAALSLLKSTPSSTSSSSSSSSSITSPPVPVSSGPISSSTSQLSVSEPASCDIVPCDFDGCGQMIEINNYLQHQREHEANSRTPFHVQHGHQRYKPLTSKSRISPSSSSSSSSSQSSPSGSPSASASASVSCLPIPPHPSPLTVPLPQLSDDRNFVAGIIPQLRRIFTRRPELNVYICNPIQFFYRAKGDGGFGCGYKNIQTLCSALLQFDLYKEVLFDGKLKKYITTPSTSSPTAPSSSSSYFQPPSYSLPPIPTIRTLQSCIDMAHQRGYDVVGGAQVGQLRGSKTWIGAVEVHALLCSYGVKSELIDFKAGKVGLLDFVWNYFAERSEPIPTTIGPLPSPPPPLSSSSSSPNSSNINHVTASPFIPPLYFQHQGHSRTIIGILRDHLGRRKLLVLDPDMSGGGPRLLRGLTNGDPSEALKLLYRNEDTLGASEYQMVIVSKYGLMTREEQERSKQPVSTVVSAIETQKDKDGNHIPMNSSSAGPAARDRGGVGINSNITVDVSVRGGYRDASANSTPATTPVHTVDCLSRSTSSPLSHSYSMVTQSYPRVGSCSRIPSTSKLLQPNKQKMKKNKKALGS